jgi:hypothetical protein
MLGIWTGGPVKIALKRQVPPRTKGFAIIKADIPGPIVVSLLSFTTRWITKACEKRLVSFLVTLIRHHDRGVVKGGRQRPS